MSNKITAFYRGNVSIEADFSGKEISSDGAILLLEKLERKHKLVKYFSKFLPDKRNPLFVVHEVEKLLKQRVFLMMQGYEDCNDVATLKNDPIISNVLEGDLASQPTLSRFENSLDKKDIFTLCYAWLAKYVEGLKGRKKVIIDIDCTDDATYGKQQLSLFNGFYGRFVYNELFFHDGQTGEIILPVLRPGNSHSNKWYVSMLKRIIKKIRASYPAIEIYIRADSGFSCAPFYDLAEKFDLKFCLGIASNNVLKTKVASKVTEVKTAYLDKGEKHQSFLSFEYQAKSWSAKQQCYSKVESTGKGMNTRHVISNLKEQTAHQIYFDYYVKRGDRSENRIKEVKLMCFSDRLSNHRFWANFFRLFISSLAYQMFVKLKQAIQQTKFDFAKKWQVSSIRTRLLKVGATIKETKRRIYYQFSKAFVHQDLLSTLLKQ